MIFRRQFKLMICLSYVAQLYCKTLKIDLNIENRTIVGKYE